MKKSIIIIAAILMAGFSTKVMAQVSADNTAGGTIVTQLGITKVGVTGLDFGKMAVSNTLDGTCILNTLAAPTPTGGVNLSASTRTNAIFAVTGENGLTYAITLPASFNVTNTTGSGAETMLVNNLKIITTSNGTERTAVGATSILHATAGTDQITVGATLNVTHGQVRGVYTATFPTTVAYN